MKSTHVIFLGAPGSGKGTQCKKLQNELKVPHLSTGDILRQGIEQNQTACLEAKQYMDTGALVPDELMIAIFQQRLSMPDCQIGFILDGFPRTSVQAESLDRLLEKLMLPLNCAIYLAVPDNILVERLSGRLSCSNPSCGAIYHMKTAPPKVPGICDLCGSALKQRADDKPEVVAERLKAYKAQTAPLIDYYKTRGILRQINGEHTPSEIYTEIIQNLLEK
jgi:adenylate kinase